MAVAVRASSFSCSSFGRSSRWRLLSNASRTSATAAGQTGRPPSSQMLVYVPPHPLVRHYLSMARNEATPPSLFRGCMAQLGRLLIYEATSDWHSTTTIPMNSPCGECDGEFIDPSAPIRVVPILRAGLVLLEQSESVLPCATTHHLGYVRDEETLEASMYLNKLPDKFGEEEKVLLVDPMLATGGTMAAAIDECVKRGAAVRNIRCVVAVCAPPALNKLNEKYKELTIYAGCIDEVLNEKGYIVPGLGDAGDRSFGTLE